jgi:glycosyltransferase involved in cell wall biosynthesis
MKITVILCTYNRSGNLGSTLASIASSTLPKSVEWEVLVVDNNSTDQTRTVVEGFCRKFPGRFRYLFEPQPGKSFALNSGVREARGDVLAFTDDDVIVVPAWLQNLTVRLEEGLWSGVGGRTLPAETISPPRWLPLEGWDSMAPILYAHCDWGDKPRELDWPPYGVNMAFRKAMFEKYGGFRTDLGPSPNKSIPRPNEDTEFGRRLMAGGERLCYEPSAVVYHPVPKNRIRKDYFLTWKYDYGRAGERERGPGPVCFGVRQRFFTAAKVIGVELPKGTLLWVLELDPRRRFIRKCRVWESAGRLVEICRLLRDRKGSERQGPDHETFR